MVTLTEPQRMGLLAHECLHPALHHLWRRGGRDRTLWLIAADYVVNSVLLNTVNDDGSRAFELPPDGLYDSRFDGMSVEQVYGILREEAEEEGSQPQGCPDHQHEHGNGRVLDGQFDKPIEDDDDDDSESDKGKAKQKKKGKPDKNKQDDAQGSGQDDDGDDEGEGQGAGASDDEADDEQDGAGAGAGDDGEDVDGDADADGDGEGDGEGDESDSDAEGQGQGGQGGGEGKDDYENITDDENVIEEDLEEQWRQLINQAVINAKARARGNLPGDIERLVEEITEPQMPWQQVVDQYVTEIMRDDYDMMRPDRRFFGDGFYFPDLYSEGLDAWVCIDVSGSISDAENAAFVGEAAGLLHSRGVRSVRIIACDMRITFDETITPYDEVPTRFGGRGGTDFRPPFRLLDEPDCQRPKLIIYMTDMCGPFPEDDPGVPVLWLASVPPYMSFENLPQPNFGTVIQYQPILDREDARVRGY